MADESNDAILLRLRQLRAQRDLEDLELSAKLKRAQEILDAMPVPSEGRRWLNDPQEREAVQG